MSKYRAFLSYQREDAQYDREIFQYTIKGFPAEVSANLINASFSVWYDQSTSGGIEGGTDWAELLKLELETCHILLIFLTPRWLASESCIWEFRTFQASMARRGLRGCIIPLLVRPLETEAPFFTPEQRLIYQELRTLQFITDYSLKVRKDSRPRSDASRAKLITSTASVLARLRSKKREIAESAEASSGRASFRPVFTLDPVDFDKFDVVKSVDVVIEEGEQKSKLLAQAEFERRVFIRGDTGVIEFGVRRAYLTIDSTSEGAVSKLPRVGEADAPVRYLTPHDGRDCVCVCLQAHEGAETLGDFGLPPSEGENYLCHVGNVAADTPADSLRASLRLNFSVPDLYLVDEASPLSVSSRDRIEAILKVVIEKAASRGYEVNWQGDQIRPIMIQRREQNEH